MEERRKREEDVKKRAHVDNNYIEEEDSEGFIVFKDRPKGLNRQIEEAIYDIHQDDYNKDGLLVDNRAS